MNVSTNIAASSIRNDGMANEKKKIVESLTWSPGTKLYGINLKMLDSDYSKEKEEEKFQ